MLERWVYWKNYDSYFLLFAYGTHFIKNVLSVGCITITRKKLDQIIIVYVFHHWFIVYIIWNANKKQLDAAKVQKDTFYWFETNLLLTETIGKYCCNSFVLQLTYNMHHIWYFLIINRNWIILRILMQPVFIYFSYNQDIVHNTSNILYWF